MSEPWRPGRWMGLVSCILWSGLVLQACGPEEETANTPKDDGASESAQAVVCEEEQVEGEVDFQRWGEGCLELSNACFEACVERLPHAYGWRFSPPAEDSGEGLLLMLRVRLLFEVCADDCGVTRTPDELPLAVCEQVCEEDSAYFEAGCQEVNTPGHCQAAAEIMTDECLARCERQPAQD